MKRIHAGMVMNSQNCVERLHEELSEVNHIYTDHVKGLHNQIADLEKRVEELQVEISTSQKDRRDQTMALKQEKADLQAQLEQLKREYSEYASPDKHQVLDTHAYP